MEARRGHSRQSSLTKEEELGICGDLIPEKKLESAIPLKVQIKQMLKNKKKAAKSKKCEPKPAAGEGSSSVSESIRCKKSKAPKNKKLLKKHLHAFHLRSHLRFSTSKILAFRQICEKGLGSDNRGLAWQVLMASTCEQFSLRQENPQLYQNMLSSSDDQQALTQIEKDLVRLFACSPLFEEKEVQESLRNVLKAVAAFYPEVGYCQGMDHIAGFLVLQMSEEDSFWAMLRLIDSYGFSEMWKPGLPAMPKCFYVTEKLLEKHLPRIYNHIKQLGIDISMFATSWFMTIFLYNHTFDLSVRLWDSFLFEGFHFMYVVVLALLSLHEEEILQMGFEQTLKFLQFNSTKENVEIDPDVLMACCGTFKNHLLTDLLSIEKEYAANTGGSGL